MSSSRQDPKRGSGVGQGAAAKPTARPSVAAAPKGTGRSAAAGRPMKREAGMENTLAVHASCLEEVVAMRLAVRQLFLPAACQDQNGALWQRVE